MNFTTDQVGYYLHPLLHAMGATAADLTRWSGLPKERFRELFLLPIADDVDGLMKAVAAVCPTANPRPIGSLVVHACLMQPDGTSWPMPYEMLACVAGYVALMGLPTAVVCRVGKNHSQIFDTAGWPVTMREVVTIHPADRYRPQRRQAQQVRHWPRAWVLRVCEIARIDPTKMIVG